MVRIGAAWDRAVEVFQGRGRMLAGIVAATLIVPGAIQSALQAFAGPDASGGLRLLIGLVGFIVVVLLLFGQLALVAAASDPATTRADAYRLAWRRLLPAIGIFAVAGIAFMVALIPIGVAVARAGIDFTAMSERDALAAVTPGTAGFVLIYLLVYLIVAMLVSARLFVLNPVIVNERDGIGSYARSFVLTRGATWRILGVLLLLGIVLLVAVLATQAVVTLVLRLLLGANGLAFARFVAAVAVSFVTATYTVVMATLTAQFYVLARDGAELSGAPPTP